MYLRYEFIGKTYRVLSLLFILLLGLSALTTSGKALTTITALDPASAAWMVKDITPGSGSSYADDFIVVDGILYFRACDTTNGCELWRSDGSSAGTYMVKDINPGPADSYPFDFVAYDGYFNDSVIYFIAEDGTNGYQIWKSDGSLAGTVQAVASLLNPDDLTVVGDELLFVADDPVYGQELWNNNGTYNGSMLTQDINPGAAGSSPDNLTVFQGTLLFTAYDDFHGYGRELWRWYDSVSGAILVKDINPGVGSSVNSALIVLGNKVLFSADNSSAGLELWQSDGTAVGTTLLSDIVPGAGDSYPQNLTRVQDRVFFLTGVDDKALRVTDGTAAGTQLVQDLDDTLAYGQLTAYKDKVCFQKHGSPGGVSVSEMWCSDGVTTNRINTALGASYVNRLLTASDTSLYITASDGVYGDELWQSDGTSAGTHMVKDICPGFGSSDPSIALAAGPRLFFVADNCQNGAELWIYYDPLQMTHQVFLPVTLR